MSTSGDGHVCSICGRLFTNSKDLTDHKRYHEDDEQKCDICDKMFKNKTILAAHKRLQHPVAILTYTCNVCDKILTNSSSFSRHKKSHMEKNFNVPFATKILPEMMNLKFMKIFVYLTQ